jgi:hypothetical protein
MKKLGCVLFVVLWSGLAFGQDNMDWAYPVTPKPEPLDSVQLKQVPGSAKKYTQAQIDDPFNPPDWFPDEHPTMPEIVAHGGPKPAGRACAQCHLPSGDGHPESSGLAGLPANYIIRQMAAFKNGELLARAGDEFEAFVTVARNLPFQQDLSRFSIAVIVLRARSNRVADLRALIPDLLATLPVAKRGEVTWVGSEQRA